MQCASYRFHHSHWLTRGQNYFSHVLYKWSPILYLSLIFNEFLWYTHQYVYFKNISLKNNLCLHKVVKFEF